MDTMTKYAIKDSSDNIDVWQNTKNVDKYNYDNENN